MNKIGLEYTIVGWCKNKSLMGSSTGLVELLVIICKAINMRIISVTSADIKENLNNKGIEPFHDEGGSSASLILSTSHINIHGWPHRDPKREDGAYFWLNIGSCRTFNPDVVDEVIKKEINTTDIQRFIRRLSSSHVYTSEG